jgi:hypothetical protein
MTPTHSAHGPGAGHRNLPDSRPPHGDLRLALGGIVLSFVPANGDLKLDIGDRYRPFLSGAPPEVTLHIHYGPAPYSQLGDPLFDSGGNWALHRVHGRPVVRLRTPEFDPHQLVVLQPDLRRGDIYCLGEAWAGPDGHRSPLGYPLEEVLMVHLLARGRGLLLHAAAICDGDRAFLFAGTSGAGKSTMVALWEGCPGVSVLSDDRVILRQQGGRFWAYGTPWHGDARAVSPRAVPLDRIFVIQHAPQNRAGPLDPLAAASRLLVRSFPTFWDAEGMAFTLQFLGRLSQALPCHELGFVPGGDVVDFVRCVT